MSFDRWGPEGPPREAYSRVTDPERFEPLHTFALDLLARLDARFEVERFEAFGLDAEIEKAELGRPTIRLAPRQQSSAPIAVAFTAFPGLIVRCGRWLVRGFPACGCDACDETAEGQIEQFAELIDHVTAGRFREAVAIPPMGAARYKYELGRPPHNRGWTRLERARAREWLGGGPRSFSWKPWPAR